jgi:deferrochelatase/peroxidase EfeB
VLDERAASFQPRLGYQGLEACVDAIVVGGPNVDDEGVEAGTLLGGLFFIAFMQHPAQFIQLQRSLAGDALNEYIHHTGSAVFAVPPGLRPGQHWGDVLFT